MWYSSDESIATITNDGYIRALKAGDVWFTALTPDFEYSDHIWATVREIPFAPFNSLTLDSGLNAAFVNTGKAITWAATISPSTTANLNSLIWQSAAPHIASVSVQGDRRKATVGGNSPGMARITVSSPVMGRSAASTITVRQSVGSVGLNRNSLPLTIGQTSQLTHTISPSNAYDKSVTWSSSNPNIAVVSSSGLVTARGAGTVTVTVTTREGGKTASCTVTVSNVSVANVRLVPNSLVLNIGNTANLSPTVNPANATNKNLTWSSSNNNIATVSASGQVRAVAPGNATITARSVSNPNVFDICTVNVRTIPVASVRISPGNNITLDIDKSADLTATIDPTNATNKTVTWSSSNNNVATVSSAGRVTAKGAGNATISVRTNDGGRTASLTVTVRQPIISVNNVTVTSPLTLTEGGQGNLTATVTPANATNKSVTWSSSNTSVATVSDGVVTARAPGTATITVKTNDGNKTASSRVTVNARIVSVTSVSLNKTTASLAVGQSENLTATVHPANATNKRVSWSSSNDLVVSVSPAPVLVSQTGRITAIKEGTARITVTTADGNKSAVCSVTVTVPVRGISLISEAGIYYGYDEVLVPTFNPRNATNKNVTWSSSNNNIATVSTDAKVSAKGIGTAIITAISADGGYRAQSTVTVKGYGGAAPPPEINYTEAQIAADIAAGRYTREDYNYLVALAKEASDSYAAFYAVACAVRNRVNSPGFPNSYRAVIIEGQGTTAVQFEGYAENLLGDPLFPYISNAAVAVLRGETSTVSTYCFFFGRITGNDLWFRSERERLLFRHHHPAKIKLRFCAIFRGSHAPKYAESIFCVQFVAVYGLP